MLNKLITFLKNHYYILFIIIVIILLYPVSIDPFGYTFNFADNLGYAKTIELLKMSIYNGTPFYIGNDLFFIGKDYKIFFITPLWQSLGVLFSHIMPSITFINLTIIFSLFFNLLFTYKLNLYITKNNQILSFLGAVIFGVSSLVLYANWFNLMGLFFIPLIILNLLKYIDTYKIKYLLYFSIFLLLLILSSTYFIPIIGIILFSFFIYNIKGNLKKILSLGIISLLLVGISFIIYKEPFKKLDSYGKGINMNNLLEERKVNSNIDLINLFTPNNNNIYTKGQLFNISVISNIKANYFRYSNYLPIPVVLLLLLLLTIKYSNKRRFSKNSKIGITIIGISLMLFMGDKIVINGYDLGIKNLLYYIKQLPNGEILRKSAYFFFPLTFGISLLLVSFFSEKYNKKYNFIFIVLSIFILLMNVGPYYGKTFKIHSKNDLISNLPNASKILTLPNSHYNNWEFQYDILKYNKDFKILKIGNATLPNYNKEYGNEYLNLLINNKNINISKECKLGIDIEYIFLYKKYVSNFFFYTNIYYQKTLNNIKSCKNFYKIGENEDLIIYKILNEQK